MTARLPTSDERLDQLSAAVLALLGRRSTVLTIERLKNEVRVATAPFVWEEIEVDAALGARLPDDIRSAWIFVLKQDTPSHSHYHPNSIQHMVVLEGAAIAKIGDSSKEMTRFDPDKSANAVWEVIAAGVPHEFFPRGQHMVVMSFHTCAASELLEIDAATGRERTYDAWT